MYLLPLANPLSFPFDSCVTHTIHHTHTHARARARARMQYNFLVGALALFNKERDTHNIYVHTCFSFPLHWHCRFLTWLRFSRISWYILYFKIHFRFGIKPNQIQKYPIETYERGETSHNLYKIYFKFSHVVMKLIRVFVSCLIYKYCINQAKVL